MSRKSTQTIPDRIWNREKFTAKMLPLLPLIYAQKTRWNLGGIATFFLTELNAKALVFVSVFNIIFGFAFGYDRYEWMAIIIAFTVMWTAEMLNTGIERVVDLVTDEYKPLAKEAKDIAGGGAIIASLHAIVIFAIINFF